MYRKIQKYYTLILLLAFIILAPISLNISNPEPVLIAHAQTQPPAGLGFLDYLRYASYVGSPGTLMMDAMTSLFPDTSKAITSGIGNFIGREILGVGSFTTWLGGKIFDSSIDRFVVKFGSSIRENEFETALTRSWSTVRDICNLAFIFGFIYIGIMTIISPDSASMKRFLARIIIGALLINFSLYITQVVIDFTNFTAVKIYDAIVPPNETQDGKPLTISKAIGNYLGINGIFSKVEPDVLAQMSTSGSFAYYLAATVFLIVTGFTLAAGGLHLLVRFVELVLIMIFSPIFFAALVFPQTEKYADKVKHKLLSSSFYAPIFLLLLYLSLSIANALVKPVDQGVTMISVITNTTTGKTGAFAVVINFIIIIFLLVSAIRLAKKMSVYGGQMAINLGSSARKSAQGYLGRGAVRLADAGIKKIPGMAGGMQGAEKFRQQLRGSDKWYARAGGKVFGATVGATATTAMGAKFGSKQSVTDVDKEEKGYKKAYEENAWLEAAKKKVTSGTPIELERTVINATESQTAALLKAFEKNEAVYKQILGITPNNRIEKLLEEKNEQLDDTKKNLLKTRRNGVIDEKLVREENARRTAEAAKTGSTPILVAQIDDDKRMVAQAMVGDLEARGFEFVEKYAGYLTAAQIEDMKKNKNFVESELKKIDAARAAYFEGLVAATNPTRTIDIQNEIKSRKPKDAAKLPEKILADAAATPQLSIDILNAIIADNSVEYATQRKVVANVRTMLAGTQTPDPTLVKYINSSRMQERYP